MIGADPVFQRAHMALIVKGLGRGDRSKSHNYMKTQNTQMWCESHQVVFALQETSFIRQIQYTKTQDTQLSYESQ